MDAGTTLAVSSSGEDTTDDPDPGTSTSGGPDGGSSTDTAAASTTDTSDGSTSTGTSETGSSTGAPVEPCGDGFIDAALGEDCEPPAEDCFECRRDRRVFVTAEELNAEEIYGLKGADDLCRQYAHAADLPYWLTYRAWLSDSTTDVRDRMFLGDGRYITTGGDVVVIGKDEWLSGQLRLPIDRDEHGQSVQGSVWTGTRQGGVRAADPPESKTKYCQNWTSNDVADTGYIGVNVFSNADWTLYSDDQANPTLCAIPSRLYCVEGE